MKTTKKVLAIILSIITLFTMTIGSTGIAQAAESWLWPVPSSKTINQYYSANHDGIDIGGATNCSVVATMSGTVVYSRYGDVPNAYYGGGNFVVIKHSNGYYSHYAHLNSRSVSEGQNVTQGQEIGKMGSTGNSTGTHLHFAIATSQYGSGGRINVNPGSINYIYGAVNITFSNQKTYDITTNSAKVAFTTNNTSNASISNFGVLIKKSSSSSWEKDYRENYSTTYASPTTEYVIGSGKEVNYTLQSGTSYSWQPYVISNGKYYYGSVKTFSTAAPAHTHSYSNVINKATLTADGEILYKCSCGSIAARSTIYRVDSIKLSSTLYTYNGKAKKPSVKVYDRTGNQISSSNYTVQYQTGRTAVGKYAVKVTFKNNYSGTKTVYFKIRPQGTKLVSVTPGSKRFTVKWNKQATQTTGYQIQYATNSSFTSNVVTVSKSKNTTTSATIKNLKAKKKYYVRIRTYKIVNSTKYYSKWSGYKYVTTKA